MPMLLQAVVFEIKADFTKFRLLRYQMTIFVIGKIYFRKTWNDIFFMISNSFN